MHCRCRCASLKIRGRDDCRRSQVKHFHIQVARGGHAVLLRQQHHTDSSRRHNRRRPFARHCTNAHSISLHAPYVTSPRFASPSLSLLQAPACNFVQKKRYSRRTMLAECEAALHYITCTHIPRAQFAHALFICLKDTLVRALCKRVREFKCSIVI